MTNTAPIPGWIAEDDPVFTLIADTAPGRLRHANAGHRRPLHQQRRAAQVNPLPLPAAAGPARGLFAGAKYPTAECPPAAGDILLLFTDGWVEVVVAAGEEDFGQECLLAAARARLPLGKMPDELIAVVRQFADGAESSDDDVCLLARERAA